MTSSRPLPTLLGLVVVALCHAQTPTLTQPLPARSLLVGAGGTTVDLRSHFSYPGVSGTVTQVDTVLGRFNLELFNDTPQTRDNFLAYIDAGRYDQTVVHRTVANFVVQAGGYFARLPFTHIETFPAVKNEPGRSNVRGTVAMAKVGGDPDSATSEWFVNLADNSAGSAALDTQNGGFTVFARVLGTGMSVVDAIAAVPRFSLSPLTDVPLRNLTIVNGQATVTPANLIVVTSVSRIPVYPAGGRGVLAFAAESSNSAVATATISDSNLVLTAVGGGSANITVRATDTNGQTASGTFTVSVTGGVAVVTPPQSQHVAPGARVTFSVTAQAPQALTYQWRLNGQPIAGATGASHTLASAGAADMGFYAVTITSGGASVTTDYAALTVDVPGGSRLVNVSTRGRAAGGEPLTPGFVIRGSGTKRLVVRAIGPGLTQFGVGGVLADPKFDVVPLRQPGVLLTNDDWGNAASADVAALTTTSASVGAFALAAGSKDAAALATLNVPGTSNGGYTVSITPAGNTAAGVTLAEVYDADPLTSPTQLINVSTLGAVTADGLTPGFVIGGTSPKQLLIRAVGPTLGGAFGVAGALADPTLSIFPLGRDFAVATSNDWSEGGRGPALEAAFRAAGAFTLPAGSRDAAVVVRLPPGAYTAVATGVGGTTGQALVEVYDLDP